MTAMTNFLCWSPDIAGRTIATEAASPSDAVLIATHTPLRIKRVGADADAAGSPEVTESDLIHEFVNSAPKEGIRVTPVLGESGSGKSHLVRWANINIERRPGRHVIYLPKTTTSLRDVVEKLLMQRTGPVFDEIRANLAQLGDTVLQGTLERKILDELAEAVRTADATDFMTKPLVGDKGLSVLLHDPLFREHLLRPGAFITRRTEHALNGRNEESSDVPLEFTIDDLPLDIADVANIQHAARATQQLFRSLYTDANMQVAAVNLLNSCLDLAVMRAANIGVGNIQRAFMKIREQLVGEEIILLIEDFALIQGVRRDLLDAIIEVGVVQGQEKYATVRTLMAVTGGYYGNLPLTFRTRAEASSPKYEMDLNLPTQDGADQELIVDFFGRYLNAARVGKDALEQLNGKVNKCDDCPVRDACHSAFGASSDGFGLYPYNRPAIKRAVKASAVKEKPDLFSPRRVLARAIRGVLTEQAGSIKAGLFPGPDFLQHDSADLQPLPLHVRESFDSEFSDPERLRHYTLSEFWGNLGTTSISPAIYETFSLEPLASNFFGELGGNQGGAVPKPAPGPSESAPGPSESGTGFPRSLQKTLDDVDAWSAGKAMPQSIANEIRAIIREALISRLVWIDPVIKEPDTPTIDKAIPKGARTISIAGANESLALAIPPLVKIERLAKNARYIQGLLQQKAGYPKGTGDALAWLDALADRHVSALKVRIIETLESTDDLLVRAAVSLIRGAALCGALPAKAKTVDIVNAVLWQGATDTRQDALIRTTQWREVERSYLGLRAEAVLRFKAAVGVAQGTGAVHAVDDVRLRKIIKRAVRELESMERPDPPSWCVQSEKKRQFLEQLIPSQLDSCRQYIDRVRLLVPDGVSFVETVDAVSAAAKDGRESGYVPVSDLGKLDRDNANARQLEFAAVSRVEKLLQSSQSASGLDLLAIVGTDTGPHISPITQYLENSARWIEDGLSVAEAKNRGISVDIDLEIARVVDLWTAIVSEEE